MLILDVMAVILDILIKWYAALPVTPHSPIGYASFSLKELMHFTKSIF